MLLVTAYLETLVMYLEIRKISCRFESVGCTVRAVASNLPDLRVALIRHCTESFNGCSCGIKPIVENKDYQ